MILEISCENALRKSTIFHQKRSKVWGKMLYNHRYQPTGEPSTPQLPFLYVFRCPDQPKTHTIESERFYGFKRSFVPFYFLSDEHLLLETEQWSLFQTLYPWRIRPLFGLGFCFWEVRTIFPNNPFCISKEITVCIKSSKYLWQTGWSPRKQACPVKHLPFRGLLQCCSLGTKINPIFRTFSEICSNTSVFVNLAQSLFQTNIPNWLSFHFSFVNIEMLIRRFQVGRCRPVFAPGEGSFNSRISCSEISEHSWFPWCFFPSAFRNRTEKQ